MRAPAWMSLSCSREIGIGYGEEILTYFAGFCAATNSDKLSELFWSLLACQLSGQRKKARAVSACHNDAPTV